MRRTQLAAGDDDLEQMQAAFLASQQAPSTKVTHVKRTAAAPTLGTAVGQEAGDIHPGNVPVEEDPPRERSPATGIHGILGEIVERPARQGIPAAPVLAGSSASGFPVATNRKLSKFSFARRNAGTSGSDSTSRPVASSDADLGTVTSRTDSGAADGSGKELTEREQIEAENLARIQSMPPDKVEEARREVESTLSSSALAFLRNRAAKKAGVLAAAAAPTSVTAEPAPKPAVSEGLGPVAKKAAAVKQHGDITASGATVSEGLGPVADNAAPERQVGDIPPSRALRQPDGRHALPTQTVSPADGVDPAARARFCLEGTLVGWAPTRGDADAAEDVVSRDPLRSVGEQGYTMREASLLARSTQPAQRALACRVITAVLIRARPGLAESCFPNRKRSVEDQDGAETELEWGQVWGNAIGTVNVAVTLRMALDDSHQAVVTAAAHGIAALLGAGSGEDSAYLAADSLPLTGSTKVAVRLLERPHPLGAWEAYPLERDSASAGPEEQAPMDEQSVAALDPLTGLIQMQLFARLSFLLASGQAPGLVAPALAILLRCARAGSDIAAALFGIPGLLAAVLDVLGAQPPAGDQDALGVARFAARPAALKLLRVLAQSGQGRAQALINKGLGTLAKQFLAAGSSSPVGRNECSPATLALQVEALRLWRVCGEQSAFMASLDDLYPLLCHVLSMPPWSGLGSAPGEGKAQAQAQAPLTLTKLQLQLHAEAYNTAASLVHQAARDGGQEASISPGCAAALAEGVLTWLQGGNLALLQGTLTAGLVDQTLPVAHMLAALAAMLGFLAAHMEHLEHQDAGRGMVRGALLSSGLLAAPEREQGEAPENASAHSKDCFSGTVAQQLISGLAPAFGRYGPPLPTRGKEELARELVQGAATAEVLAALLRLSQAVADPRETAFAQHLGAWHSWLTQTMCCLAEPCMGDKQPVRLQSNDAERLQLRQHALALLLDLIEEHPADAHLQGVALALPTMLAPGAEPQALRALAYATRADCLSLLQDDAAVQLSRADKASLQQDATVDALVPPPEKLGQVLLEGYSAAWLGLLSQGPDDEKPGKILRVAAGALDAVGSRLPLPRDFFLLDIDSPERFVGKSSPNPVVLDTIPEDDTEEKGEQGNRACLVGGVLLLLLGLEGQAHTGRKLLKYADTLPVGMKLRGIFDLVFHPQAAAGGEELWHDPLVRQATAALLQLYAPRYPLESEPGVLEASRLDPSLSAALDGSAIKAADAQVWAAHFAASSFGDPLFAACLALLLRPNVAEDVQLGILETLADESALHLLPPLAQAPGGLSAYTAGGLTAPLKVVEAYADLLGDRRLERAMQAGSLVADLALHYVSSFIATGGSSSQEPLLEGQMSDEILLGRKWKSLRQSLPHRCSGEVRTRLGLD